MKKLLSCLTVIMILSSLFSCTNSKVEEKQKEVITKRIAYDVTISSDNLCDREAYNKSDLFSNMQKNEFNILAVKLFEKVKSGEIPAYFYNYDNEFENFELIPENQLVKLFEEKWIVYSDFIDTLEDGTAVEITVPENLTAKKIKELRFLEEWYFEEDEFCKKVIAVAPVFYPEEENGKYGRIIPYWVFIKDISE